jgi:hemoglobin/transferrin/lactoferrin receptor protein
VYEVDPILVTATRGPRALSDIPQPVSVVQGRDLSRQLPNSVTDLFRTLPGLDVVGVGVNQGRPQIRGQRGTRILLLEDGMRLNSFRRQQDFGEIPALVDVNQVERVEVVRGPASVLYGSDAIGGVVNIISRTPEAEGIHGRASVRYGSVESQKTASAGISGRFGTFSIKAGGTFRTADPYEAPAGDFGQITLEDDTEVRATGVEDTSMDFRLGWEPRDGHSLFAKFAGYSSDDAGFGGIDPALYDPGAPEIEITYPTQRWNKLSVGYVGEELGTALADRFELVTYAQDNERELDFSFVLPLGGPGLLTQTNENYTDIRTYGFRAEARKLARPGLLLTYGVDLARERAEGADTTSVLVTGFGPPQEEIETRPQLPEATFLTLGAFLQSEFEVTDRFTLIGGGRYQTVKAETLRTPGLEDQDPTSTTDGTFVAAVNGLLDLGRGLSLAGSVGRAFRSPNLIERFFDGVTPEGNGYQVRNPELDPETSLNVDLGFRYIRSGVSLELFGFRNTIYDGIRIRELDTQVNGLDAFQNTNVEELLFRGVELGAQVRLAPGLWAGGNYTWLDAENVSEGEEDSEVGDAFSSKITGTLRYSAPSDRWWASAELRHNGERKDVVLDNNPLGDLLPSFTVLNLRGGVTIFRTDGGQEHRLEAALTNVTNQLYAEFSNASFFRPEPKRNLTISYAVSF